MLSTFITSSLLVALAAAQSPTITWMEAQATVYGFGDYDWAGSVVDACPDTTVVAIRCTEGTGSQASSICSDPDLVETITIGPSDWHLTYATKTQGVSVAVEQSCSASGTAWLSCDMSLSATGKGDSAATQTAYVYTGTEVVQQTAVITAGAEKLNSTTCSSGADTIMHGRSAASLGAFGFASIVAVLLL